MKEVNGKLASLAISVCNYKNKHNIILVLWPSLFDAVVSKRLVVWFPLETFLCVSIKIILPVYHSLKYRTSIMSMNEELRTFSHLLGKKVMNVYKRPSNGDKTMM